MKAVLKGVQRVPTLLLNSTGKFTDLNMDDYTVLECEALHDLKGHLINLCKELPYLLNGEVRKTAEEIISTTVSDKITCADHRILILQLFMYLKNDVTKSLLNLLQIAIRVSQILYLPAEHRTPQRILQLYNCTWLHHELCITRFYTGITTARFFGTYLHSLVVRAPLKLEIVSQCSVHTENQERIFSQAHKTATVTSNRHPQAKTELKGVAAAVLKSENRVSKVSRHILPYKGTEVTRSLLSTRLKSWQQHLRRISTRRRGMVEAHI